MKLDIKKLVALLALVLGVVSIQTSAFANDDEDSTEISEEQGGDTSSEDHGDEE